MKFMFASDIHGSKKECEKLFTLFQEEKADRLILLGDYLYHGPRNGIPENYDPQAVVEMLNRHKTQLFCVRGNCDSEVDQMLLQVPMMADYLILPLENNHIAFVTHGHLYNTTTPPPLTSGDLLIHGHTHIPIIEHQEHYTYLNPGSVTFPKSESGSSYMIYESGKFIIKTFDRQEITSYNIP
ncbi:MAG: phosphodiesterase [Clostridia bacterium]|nr:phosphodiesterase [Clostridia bacterium]